MKALKLPIASLALLIAACGNNHSDSESSRQWFDYSLRGTWESNDPSVYSGRLEIEYNSIAIAGYEESQTLLQGSDAERPFKSFTKNAALKGYSEQDSADNSLFLLFINDAGRLQEPIPCAYYSINYKEKEFLRFTFGGREETLQKTQE